MLTFSVAPPRMRRIIGDMGGDAVCLASETSTRYNMKVYSWRDRKPNKSAARQNTHHIYLLDERARGAEATTIDKTLQEDATRDTLYFQGKHATNIPARSVATV